MSGIVPSLGSLGPPGLFGRAIDTFRDEGVYSFLRIAREFAFHWSVLAYYACSYQLRYGETAPRTHERQWFDPSEIEYVMNKVLPKDAPPFGVVPGTWDEKKVHRFEYGVMWKGLLERYEEGKPWPDTQYYQTGMSRLSEGKSLRVLDGDDQSVEAFESYTAELDRMFENIQSEGFDESAAVPVNVGRDGSLILFADGNHRTTLAQAAGIDSIPTRIVYRHEEWQRVRDEVSRANSYVDLSNDAREYLHHPDVCELVDFS